MLDVLFLLAGFYLLAKGADALVEGAATLATRWGMDRWVVGLTVVAWGTSLPEVVVSGLAAHAGSPGQALGNVLGSNVANAGLVLGAVGLILPRALVGRLSVRESAPLILSLALLYFMLRDEVLTRIEAGVMTLLFVAYTFELILRGRGTQSPPADVDVEEIQASRPWLRTILGSAAIGLGAKLVIDGATGLALKFGLDDGFVGIVIFALGPRCPSSPWASRARARGIPRSGWGTSSGATCSTHSWWSGSPARRCSGVSAATTVGSRSATRCSGICRSTQPSR